MLIFLRRLSATFSLVALMLTAACGGSSGASADAAAASPLATVAVTVNYAAANSAASALPASPPTAATSFLASAVTAIVDSFTTANGIGPSPWGLPASMGIDPVGAFRFTCGPGHLAYDDPIVYFGQPGKSHLHQFYGNLTVDASSTYSSIRATGDSTCSPTPGAPVNRSAYWMPAMLDGAGNVVRPDNVLIYYKRLPKSDPKCTRSNPGSVGDCVGIPTGLKFVAGFNMLSMKAEHPTYFYCNGGLNSDLKSNINDVISACPVGTGAKLTVNISTPDCWNGKDIDSADHRSHLAYGSYVWDSVVGTSTYRCDDAHPYVIPQLSFIAFYTIDANFAAGKWHPSSDEMVPGVPAGTTWHIDYLEGWSPTIRSLWLTNCIDGHLSCVDGDLGNGTVIKGEQIVHPVANPRLVGLSSIQ